MPNEVTIRKMYQAVKLGEDRLRNFRAARLLFLRQYSGQWYDRETAVIGNEPLNMIFGAISTIVPNLVSNFPKTVVTSKFLTYRGYAELLGLGLDYLAKEVDLRTELRRWVVDSLFTVGIMKVGTATSGNLMTFSDDILIDPGRPFARVVDFDDFILDPACRRIEEAAFVGHRVRVPRQMLLDSGLYKNDLVMKLPQAGLDPAQRDTVEQLSQTETRGDEIASIQDMVDVREIWVPSAQAVVTLPAGTTIFDEYLRIADYDGPDDGMFTYLSMTPPLPNNPMPIAPVGIWYDLHVAANKMCRKIMEQADRQKDILGYRPSAADDAQEIVDAGDGEAIQLTDPEGAKVFSFGGQQRSNEGHLAQLAHWFNLASGNTEQLAGVRSDANTATQANILQGNAAVRVEDMRDIVYLATRSVMRKLAWHLHTDPLISLPLVKQKPEPAQIVIGPTGPMQIPARIVEEQVLLTPEVRQGDFLDFHFEIESKSMSRMDPAVRLEKAMLFAGKILPAAAQAAMVCQQMGVPFSFSKFVQRMAKELDIEWMDECFYDPEFQMQAQQMLQRSPQPDGNARRETGAVPGMGGLGAIMQNGGPANAMGEMPASGPEGASSETLAAAQPAQPFGGLGL
jgi:hypothetical protein